MALFISIGGGDGIHVGIGGGSYIVLPPSDALCMLSPSPSSDDALANFLRKISRRRLSASCAKLCSALLDDVVATDEPN